MRDFGVVKGANLIQILSTLLQEGTLAAESPVLLKAINAEIGVNSEFYFANNTCIHASLSNQPFSLRKILFRRRLLERTQAEEIKGLKHELNEQPLTGYLAAKGWVSEADLAVVLRQLSELAMYETLLWPDVALSLDQPRGQEIQYWGSPLAQKDLFSVQAFVDEAEKNLPVITLLREKLSPPQTILFRQSGNSEEPLSPQQEHVYSLINQKNNLMDVLQFSQLGYFETLTALYQLLSWNYISLGQLATPRYARTAAAASAPPVTAKEPPEKSTAKSPYFKADPASSRPRPAVSSEPVTAPARPVSPVSATQESWDPEIFDSEIKKQLQQIPANCKSDFRNALHALLKLTLNASK